MSETRKTIQNLLARHHYTNECACRTNSFIKRRSLQGQASTILDAIVKLEDIDSRADSTEQIKN